MDAVFVPADAQQEIMVALAVEDQLPVDVTIGVRVFRVLGEDSLDDEAIGRYSGIH
jgi:hypothetical protein